MDAGLCSPHSVNACFAIPIAKRRHSTFLRQRKCFWLYQSTLRKLSEHGVPKGRAKLSARVRSASLGRIERCGGKGRNVY
ncbi:MAG: hypothetical protein HYS55_05620 [Candidatus Omnitrophica bacterium]|nr:hypothetical protein [Candidatus Omnitrophota bacterium]